MVLATSCSNLLHYNTINKATVMLLVNYRATVVAKYEYIIVEVFTDFMLKKHLIKSLTNSDIITTCYAD